MAGISQQSSGVPTAVRRQYVRCTVHAYYRTRSALFVLLALTAGAATASAGQVASAGQDWETEQVNAQGLDLATRQGQAAFHHRIAVAGRHVCAKALPGVSQTSDAFEDCVKAARRDAFPEENAFVEAAMSRAGVQTVAAQSR